MDAHHQLRQPCTPLLPTGVPHGVDAALRSIWSSRQPRQRPQRIRHEDHTPMFPNGFGPPPALRIAAQRSRTVLIQRCRRPSLPIQTNDRGSTPGDPVRDQDHRTSCHRRMRNAHHHAHLAQAWDPDRQRDAPRGVLADGDGPVRRRRDQRHKSRDGAMGARPLQRLAVGLPQVKTGRISISSASTISYTGAPPPAISRPSACWTLRTQLDFCPF
jgi:hypothetical protein